MSSSPGQQQSCIVKRVEFFGRQVKIVMQNENGPCPLLAIANLLSLRNELKLPSGIRQITQGELITSIVDLLLERSRHFEKAYAADYQQNISEVFPVLQKLSTGVDVNVKFHNLHAFEPTPEVAVFDLLGIPLVHGWLVDPQDSRTAAVFANRSYNELVELLFLVLGDEEMEAALSTGTLRNLSISSATLMQHHSFSSIGSPAAAAARTPSSNTAPGSRSQSFGASNTNTAAAAAAGHSAGLQTALQGLSIQEEQQQQQQQPQQQDAAAGFPALGAGVGADAAANPHANGNAAADTEADADPDAAIESIMEGLLQEICRGSSPGHIELGDSPTHNLLLTRKLAYQGSTATPSRLNPAAAAAAAGGNSSSSGSSSNAPAAATASNGAATAAEAVCVGGGCAAAQPTAAVAAAAAGEQQQQQQQQQGLGPQQQQQQQKAASAADAAVVRAFMEAHASQLTPYGLTSMVEGLKEHQLAVFFRNNHFNTLFKYEGAVYLLVTDQGYEHEPDIVWERLDSVHGDTTFCSSDFRPFVHHKSPEPAAAAAGGGSSSYSQAVAGGAAAAGDGGSRDRELAALTDLDAAIAASLAVADDRSGGGSLPDAAVMGQEQHHADADFAFALQLQLQEEEAAAARAQQQQQGQQQQPQGQGQQQQGQYRHGRVAAVQQQEQQQAPLESLRQMGQRVVSGLQQWAPDTQQQQQQQQGRRGSGAGVGARRGAGAQEDKCSIM